ncbi:hypothetical protein NONO_c17550 [Nocardia nova SH22a]|uniref:Uncharacterized protein n=1 Tax=Nocardia nova SH22a TaxID=1415166 RepID=W5TB18_9NOCA|nr:hypothetical protein [Nocardia nova]AHH16555.1 hypothetical protein NONO_c17550 [Nocardia nova SH22a]
MPDTMVREPWFAAPERCAARGAVQSPPDPRYRCECAFCVANRRVRAAELGDMQMLEMRVNLGGVS